jgi:hypothetical protein
MEPMVSFMNTKPDHAPCLHLGPPTVNLTSCPQVPGGVHLVPTDMQTGNTEQFLTRRKQELVTGTSLFFLQKIALKPLSESTSWFNSSSSLEVVRPIKVFETRHQCLVPIILATLGGWDQFGGSRLRLAWTNSSGDLISKNNQSKMDWRHGSSCRAPALQAQSPNPTKKKKVFELASLLPYLFCLVLTPPSWHQSPK